jgi:GH24 family phage-related lysozyme (muramidase)
MNPFTQAVAAPTYEALRQQQGQERAQQQAQAIKSGAFGGDRAGLERANLARQQNLATAQAIAPIFQQGYGQALQTAQQQQGVGLAAEQANRAAFQQGAQQIAGLGTGAQAAALQGAQAQLQAGAQEQQTNQADLTARYQQFLQERGYPFQTAQFLANIAMGTGALSGSTTTSTQPAGFFSDERLKEDIKRVGETDDGLPIYSYRYKGDKKTQIGLIAQDVEKEKPEAVGLAPAADGKLYKTVDYKKATEDRPHREYGGGLDVNSMGGAVMEPGDFAGGGYVDLGEGPYGIKLPKLDNYKLATSAAGLGSTKSGLAQAADTGKSIAGLYTMGKQGLVGTAPTKEDPSGSAGLIGGQGKMGGKNIFSEASDFFKKKDAAAHGGLIVGRHHYDDGGFANDDMNDNDANEDRAHVPSSALPSGILESAPKPTPLGTAQTHQGRSGMDDIKDIMSMGKMAMGMFASGGTVDDLGYIVRQHHQDGERVVADDEPSLDDPTLGLIAKHEGFRERPYYDVNALRTGFGSDTVTLPDGTVKRVDENTRVTMDDAKRDLARRAGEYQNHIKGLVGEDAWGGLDPNTRAALTSVTYNYGRLPTSVAEAVKKGDRTDIASAVNALGVHNQGVNASRRAQEAGLIDPEGQYAPVSGRSDADLPSSGAREAQYQAMPQESGLSLKGIGDTVTSDKFLVPFLSFVGSTLASKSPTLGGALGEGIVGGVSGYQQNKEVQAKMAKNVLDVIKDRFVSGPNPNDNNKPGFYNTFSQVWQTPEQMRASAAAFAKAYGVAPSTLGIEGPSAPSAPGTPGATKTATTTAQPGATTTAQPGATTQQGTGTTQGQGTATTQPNVPVADQAVTNRYKMTGPQLIDAIRNGGDQAYTDNGLVGPNDPRPLERDLAEQRQQLEAMRGTSDPTKIQLRKDLQDSIRTLDKQIADKYAYAVQPQLDKNKEEYSTLNKGYEEHRKDINARLRAYPVSRESLIQVGNIIRDYETNRTSEIKANIKSWADQFGLGNMLPANFDTMSNDRAVKEAFSMAFRQVANSQLTRAPAATLNEANRTVAMPTLAPGAAYDILGKTVGEMDYLQAQDAAYLKHVSSGKDRDPLLFANSWQEKNTFKPYAAAAFSELPFAKGMTPQQKMQIMQQHRFIPQGDDPSQYGVAEESPNRPYGRVAVMQDGKPVMEGGKQVYYYYRRRGD